MIKKAFIEEKGSRRMEDEMRDVFGELRQRDIPAELFTDKCVQRRQLRVEPDTLVVGYVQTMFSVFKILGIEAPALNDYPSVLQPYLHRRIWQSTVQELSNWIYSGREPVFAKPSDSRKRFTGHVFKQSSDLVYIERASRTTPIYCSEVLEWLTEYRLFVIRAKSLA